MNKQRGIGERGDWRESERARAAKEEQRRTDAERLKDEIRVRPVRTLLFALSSAVGAAILALAPIHLLSSGGPGGMNWSAVRLISGAAFLFVVGKGLHAASESRVEPDQKESWTGASSSLQKAFRFTSKIGETAGGPLLILYGIFLPSIDGFDWGSTRIGARIFESTRIVASVIGGSGLMVYGLAKQLLKIPEESRGTRGIMDAAKKLDRLLYVLAKGGGEIVGGTLGAMSYVFLAFLFIAFASPFSMCLFTK